MYRILMTLLACACFACSVVLAIGNAAPVLSSEQELLTGGAGCFNYRPQNKCSEVYPLTLGNCAAVACVWHDYPEKPDGTKTSVRACPQPPEGGSYLERKTKDAQKWDVQPEALEYFPEESRPEHGREEIPGPQQGYCYTKRLCDHNIPPEGTPSYCVEVDGVLVCQSGGLLENEGEYYDYDLAGDECELPES